MTGPDNNPRADQDMKSRLKSGLTSLLSFALLAMLAYFASIEIKSYLGRQALAETGLDPLPLDDALARAKIENKLVLADMSAIWCATCRKLDKEVFASATVRKVIDERYIYSRTEYESKEGEAFMQRYSVIGFPTVLILDADGNKLAQVPLTFSAEVFAGFLSNP